MPVVCGVCGATREFTEGTLVIKQDDGTTVEVIASCHVLPWLEARDEVGTKLTATGVSALVRMREAGTAKTR
jgi:hypothetical protein